MAIAAGGRVDHVDLGAQSVALQGQAVARQAQVAELRRQLGEGRRLGLVLESFVVQGDLGAGIGLPRVGVGGNQQERLRAEPPGSDPGHVGQQLVAAEAKGTDDAGGKRVIVQVPGREGHVPSS